MEIKLREKLIKLSQDSTFNNFRLLVLKKMKIFIKNFFYNEKQINEKLHKRNYEKFT